MDALTLLTADHNRVRGLFKRFESAEENDEHTEMGRLQKLIFTELEVHTKIEEKVFYPGIKEADEEIAEAVAEGIEEHHVVKVLMSEVEQLKPTDETFAAKMKVLIENVEHHAEEEEEEMFPEVRKAMSKQQLETMADKLEATKKSLGAPTLADKIDLATDVLQKLAQEQEIPGRSKLSHDELAATVAPN